MSRLRMYVVPDDLEFLHKKAEPVKKVDGALRKKMDEMIDFMRQNNGVGLAAPQIGDSRRFCVVEFDKVVYRIINPVITQVSDETDICDEGCLSLPKKNVNVERPVAITFEFTDERGHVYEAEAEGYLARILQHEFDHLDGVLMTDHPDQPKKSPAR